MERAVGNGHNSTPIRNREQEWVKVFVPKRFKHATFETYRINQHNKKLFGIVKQWVKTYNEETDQGLILAGSIGTGKTHLMFSIGRALARRGIWAIYKNFASVCVEMKDSWRRQESTSHIKELLQEANLLLLDDLGAEMRDNTDQGWVTEFVYDVVEKRYNEMLPTVVATNLNMDDLAERYTERVASRLAEMSVPLWVEGYDYRLSRRAG